MTTESSLSLYSDQNSQKIEKQANTKFAVILGETPSGVNDVYHNRGKKYPHLDKRVFQSYARASKARNKVVISDTYVKAIRWASDKIIENDAGIVSFVCKNNFIDDLAFDGLRKHLAREFDKVYVLDLFISETRGSHQYFAGDRAVLFLIKNVKADNPGIFYCRIDWDIFRRINITPG
jgi:predicted helicase